MPAVVPPWRSQTRAGLGIVVNDEDRRALGRWHLVIGDEKQRVHHLAAQRDFNPKLMLSDVLPVCCVHDFHTRLFDERRPRAHDPVPCREDFCATTLPVGGSSNQSAVCKHEGRTEFGKIRLILLRRREKFCQFGWRLGNLGRFGCVSEFSRETKGSHGKRYP